MSGGGRRPFGYEADRITIRQDEAGLIKQAVDDVLAGASVRSIARRWTEAGVATVTGAAWSGTTVKRLLCSARIAGQREHQGQLTTAVWPPIITLSESARVRTLLNRSDRRLNTTGSSRRYLREIHGGEGRLDRLAVARLPIRGGCVRRIRLECLPLQMSTSTPSRLY